MGKIKTIGILTSGGDAPGMNAAIRAVTRAGIYNGFEIKGVYRGYEGLITDDIKPFTTENVSGIIGQGGTILKTARSKGFKTMEGRQQAYDNLVKEGIDALVVIGGNGSLTGAMMFAQEFDFCCIGLPGTIDNDLYGTDSTIGYDTTMNTIMECVDRIRDTAQSHERIFFVEVMGRDAGFLAQNSAIASGAEAAIIPEDSTGVDQLARFMERGIRKSKRSCIVIVSESLSVELCIMLTVYARSSLIMTYVCQFLVTCSVAVALQHVTESLQVVRVLVLLRLSFRVSATSWLVLETMRWFMFHCLRQFVLISLSTRNLSRFSTS